MRRLLLPLAIVMLCVAALSYAVFAPPAGARTPASMRHFNPSRVAQLEVAMWQAYYAKNRVYLFADLVMMLREQYRYSWSVAAHQGFYFARAAARFGDLRSNYEVVLPDLEKGYAIARDWSRADFDPQAVARAELAWWVARRVPEKNSAEEVGKLIAQEYELLYGVPREQLFTSGFLRAQAGALRDSQAQSPDWNEIARFLQQSYIDLRQALSTQTA
jgi:hypothetical protein